MYVCTCYRPAFDVVHLGFRVHGTRSFQALANFFTSSVRLPPRGPARQPCARGAAQDPRRSWCAPPLHCLYCTCRSCALQACLCRACSIMRINHFSCKPVCVEPVRSCASTTSLASVSVSSLFVLSLRKRVCRSLMFTFCSLVFLIPSPTRSRSYIIRRC